MSEQEKQGRLYSITATLTVDLAYYSEDGLPPVRARMVEMAKEEADNGMVDWVDADLVRRPDCAPARLDDFDLVYHEGDYDLSLGEARELCAPRTGESR